MSAIEINDAWKPDWSDAAQRKYEKQLTDLIAFQRAHYAQRLAEESNLEARRVLRAELHRLKNSGYGY